VHQKTPTASTGCNLGTPASGWDLGSGRYHPAAQYWPLQLTYAAIVLALAAGVLTAGWRATRPRAIV